MEKFYFSDTQSFDREVFARDVFKDEKFIIIYDFWKHKEKIKELLDITLEEYEQQFDIMVLKINKDENLTKIQKKLSKMQCDYEIWNGNRYISRWIK